MDLVEVRKSWLGHHGYHKKKEEKKVNKGVCNFYGCTRVNVDHTKLLLVKISLVTKKNK